VERRQRDLLVDSTTAGRARRRRIGKSDDLLELITAGAADVLVDGHRALPRTLHIGDDHLRSTASLIIVAFAVANYALPGQVLAV